MPTVTTYNLCACCGACSPGSPDYPCCCVPDCGGGKVDLVAYFFGTINSVPFSGLPVRLYRTGDAWHGTALDGDFLLDITATCREGGFDLVVSIGSDGNAWVLSSPVGVAPDACDPLSQDFVGFDYESSGTPPTLDLAHISLGIADPTGCDCDTAIALVEGVNTVVGGRYYRFNGDPSLGWYFSMPSFAGGGFVTPTVIYQRTDEVSCPGAYDNTLGAGSPVGCAYVDDMVPGSHLILITPDPLAEPGVTTITISSTVSCL